MSSIILQAADLRVMMPNAYHMCHYGSSELTGNHLDLQKQAGFEKRIAEDMMDIYAFRCKSAKYFKEKWDEVTEEKVKNYLKRKLKDGDWYTTAYEAVYYGFADEVLEQKINSLKR
jgi:ATP-dependent protease ClpP protease subunit